MSVAEPARIRLHEDPALFREAVTFTAAETGFVPRLIEKDYYCTVLLEYLAAAGAGPDLIRLVREKLAVSGNEPVDVSAARLAALRPQVESQLKPVLRAQDFADFDLERAFRAVAGVAAALG